MSPVVIVFGSIITIVGMALTYNLLVLIIDKRNGGSGQRRNHHHHQGDLESWRDLADRAEDLSRRLQNLEDILMQNEKKEEEEK
ncbi:MAG: hypothetical protein CSA81_10560 [Acidobacteria bacterium]|nr:MAG: hypothetical protein CSA81_10560 [Acidobacteriota bacterium]PIE89921.1 MAG: hypothetical protein CR997_08895 [Acidobacteriota bacterium]